MKASKNPRRNNKIKSLVLEEIIGLTTKNCNGLASSTNTSYCVYPAGSVAVVYDVVSRTQSHLVAKNRAPKPLSCVAVSPDGRFVGAGESGNQPAVLVWDCTNRTCLAELKSHHYGVACIAFSPDGQLLASVGFPRDDSICLWHWQSRILQARIKACSPCSTTIYSISFSSDAKSLVTAGNKHLSIWNIKRTTRLRSTAKAPSHALERKPVHLDCNKGSSFVSVICIHGSICGLTNTGSLCVIRSGASDSEVVNLKVDKGFALSASSKLIACACSGGIIKLFDVRDLTHLGNLYYSDATNHHEANTTISPGRKPDNNCQLTPGHPDALACQFSTSQKLVVVYSDHSLYVWDIDDKYKLRGAHIPVYLDILPGLPWAVTTTKFFLMTFSHAVIHVRNFLPGTRCCVLVSHLDCVMDIKALACEHMHDPSTACAARGCSGGVSFATCSADGIIRLWDLVFQPGKMDDLKETYPENDMLGINSDGSSCLVSTGTFERDIIGLDAGTQGFRSMAASSDGKQLAVGDCQGNLYIYDLQTFEYLCLQGAHDDEVLSLSFSTPSRIGVAADEPSRSYYFLASGGRDGIIHVFDVNRDFALVATICDHSAAVTSVQLSSNGCKMLSCSADGQLILRNIFIKGGACQTIQCQRQLTQLASQGIVYDMAVDPNMEFAASVGKDKRIKTFNLSAGKLLRSCKQNGELGEPMKISMDQSCSYLLCCYTTRCLCIFESSSGEMVAQAVGHGQVITGAIFLPDCKRIISVDRDGCIFVWKIPPSLGSRMLQKNMEFFGLISPKKATVIPALSRFVFMEDNQENVTNHNVKVASPVGQGLVSETSTPRFGSTFKFSVSRLPAWARSKITSPDTAPLENISSSPQTELKKVSPPALNEASNNTRNSSQHDSGTASGSSSDAEDVNDSAAGRTHKFSKGKGKQWNTVYTVSLEHLSTPEIWGSTDNRIPVKRFGLESLPRMTPTDEQKKQIALESNTASCPSVGSVQRSLQHDANDIHGGRNVDLNDVKSSTGASISQEDTFGHHIDHTRACTRCDIESSEEVQPEADNRIGHSSTDTKDPHALRDNLSTQQFGNLSSGFKSEEKGPSAKRRYSARYVVKRDRFRGFMNLANAGGF